MCDHLWAYTWGMAGARLRDVTNRVVATGVPMSAVPRLSQFWNAPTTNGTYLLTWQDFALNRDTNTLLSAQLELCPSGDYIARSNEVERVYRRVNPDDWDDDGYPNDADQNPYVFDEGGFGPQQELPQGANEDAYCWVDIVVSNANALVTFAGDGPSALPDPRFVASAGETNRVTILIGKTYIVTCPMPIAVVDKSSADIDVQQESPTEMHICWPVEIYADEVQMRGGAAFAMVVSPGWLGGRFTWTNSCCSISSYGGTFTYSCGGSCTCTGCAALGYYTYESYRRPACGGACGCGSHPGGDGGDDDEEDDDGPYDAGASVSFSKSAVIFEDRYENTPGAWVGRQSTDTDTALHCVAHGGPNGGHVRFEIVGEDKLGRVSGISLPFEGDVGAGKKIDFKIEYNGKLPSGSANDIIAISAFTENVAGATQEVSTATLTSIKVEIEPTSYREGMPNRHVMGVRERFMIHRQPSSANLSINVASGWLGASGYQTPTYTCSLAAGSNGIEILSPDGARYVPSISVVEPQGIICNEGQSFCSDGVIAMKLYPYILPLEVSFSGISMMEVPSLGGGPSGYFTNAMFSAFWHHTTDRGAGVWHHPSNENFFFYDTPSFDLYCPPPLTHGTIVWTIPLGWGENGATTLSDIFNTIRTEYQQVFTLDENGGLRIDKFGQWIKVSFEGYITHSPDIHDQ